MRLRQATTNYWKERFARFGKEIIYLEFEYPWQEGITTKKYKNFNQI